jgi:hypothetical protein
MNEGNAMEGSGGVVSNGNTLHYNVLHPDLGRAETMNFSICLRMDRHGKHGEHNVDLSREEYWVSMKMHHVVTDFSSTNHKNKANDHRTCTEKYTLNR